jgi:hypothetical protein
MAERTGLEPATPGVTGRYSNQLNYRSAVVFIAFLKRARILIQLAAKRKSFLLMIFPSGWRCSLGHSVVEYAPNY